MRLAGKTAIITGAAHGIGRAIAELFAAEGARIFIADVDERAGEATASSLRNAGRAAEFVLCDVSRPAVIRRVVQHAAKRAGQIDVLCNNAAYISKLWHHAAEATDGEWEKCVQVSLMGTMWFTREVLPRMAEQGGGSIINISSVQGLVAGCNSAAYTTVKHALIGLTRSVACDFGSDNIRCNVICPGAIRTRISPKTGSELHRRQVAKTFLGRVGQPREVATAALFLASDESSYVTGAVLAVDGGWTAI